VTLFRVTFLLAEIPSQLISKKVGPDRWIPTLMVSWSLVAISQFWLSGRVSFLVCRSLMGLLQGGFIPDLILYLSYYFTGIELPFRLAILWTATRLSGVVAPLLAYGVLRLRGHNGYEGWRWLFLTEGLLNIIIACWSIFMMAPSPTQTKAWWRPKGWFTEHEEKILVNRILRDDPSKGGMHNRQALTPKLFWESLCDYDLWPLYLLGLTFLLPAMPPNQYLTLTLRELGFDTLTVSLLTIPAQVGTTLNVSTLPSLLYPYTNAPRCS
jgi:MFS family permease